MLRAGSLAIWMQWGAGVSATFAMLGYGAVIWKGPWPREAWPKQLELLGQGHMLFGGVVLLSLTAIAGLRLAFSGSKDGFKAGVERDDDDQDRVTRITTDVHTTPAPPAPPPTVSVTVENSVASAPPKQE
jgi:hypothetical protein